MKMNINCLRDILLALENMPYTGDTRIYELMDNLPQYSEDEVDYNVLKLYEAGFIKGITYSTTSCPECICSIIDITFNGHEFLNSVRDEGIFSEVKSTCKKIGAHSVSAVFQIATNIISEIISKHMK